MFQPLRTYLKRIVHAFSTRTRAGVFILVLFISGWFVSQFVLAQKEANVYVFPASVSSDGWNEENQSLGQDLSPEAELTDFNAQNSAYLLFGNSTVTATGTSATSSVSSGDTSTPTESTPPPSSAFEIVNTHTDPTIQENTVHASPATSSDQSDTFPVPPLPNPFVPSVDVTPEAPPVSSSSPQSFRTFHGEIKNALKYLLAATPALAIDVPADSNVENDNDTASSSSISTQIPPAPLTSTDTSVTETADASGTAITSTTSDEGDATPMSDDPYSVASCTTLGLTCHLMTYSGFGLGDALLDKPVTGATLELSLAGRADIAGNHDRILVRAYHHGRWIYLGAADIKGEFSNAQRSGYLSFDLSAISKWSDLSDLKIVVEYARETEENASVYVDGLWVNVHYENDGLSGSSPEELALSAQNIRSALSAKDAVDRKVRRDLLTTPEGTQIAFTHADDHPDAKLIIKSDKALYHAFGSAKSYFNVTNDSDSEQVVRLQFHFPSGGGSVKSLSRFARNVPYKVGNLKYDSVGYFCPSGWGNASATSSVASYQCSDTAEIKACDTLNDDKTNCIENNAKVGLSEDTEYRDGWSLVPLQSGSFRDEGGLFAEAIDFILGQLPKDAIPESQAPVSYVGDSILLQPGQTIYLRADFALPENGRGDFYIEGAAESGAYGLLKSSWDGSWNYRIPLSVGIEKSIDTTTFAAPISLDQLPQTFWNRVNANGSDLRFVDGTGVSELPYWLASWNYAEHKGLAWVRVPYDGSSTSSPIYLYYGDKDAEPISDSAAPFRTDDLTPRAILMGGSQRDMTLHVIAAAEQVRVRAGEHNDVLLKKGESALFDALAPGTVVFADGPVTLSLETLGGGASIVPFGYAGHEFIAPGIGGDYSLALTSVTQEETHAEVRTSGASTQTLDPIYGTVVSMPIDLSQSHRIDATFDVLSVLGTEDSSVAAPLYPASNETLYGFSVAKTTAGYGEDNSGLILNCAGGGREEIDGRREGMSTTFSHCAQGLPELSDALRVSALSHPASVLVHSDTHMSSFIPKSEFTSSYVLPEDSRSLAILCAPEDGPIAVGIFDPEGVKIDQTTCEGRGARPGKAMLIASSSYILGSTLRSLDASSSVFMAGAEGAGTLLSSAGVHPFSVLMGNTLMRGHAPNHPDVTFGDEEFVVPGEHRLLDVDPNGVEKKHVDKLLTNQREFSVRQKPGFTFKYTPQSNSLVQGIRSAFGVDPFAVTKVTLKHPLFGEIPAEYEVTYGDNDEWTLTLDNTKEHLHPGKYTLHVEIEEGGTTYTDEYDFYWGVLAINENKSVFTPGEDADISIGALSDNGNTICDANLKLWITQPESGGASSTESEIPVKTSGQCNGNNVVDVPDYSATYHFDPNIATGTYQVKLVRLDSDGNIASQITDTINVEPRVPIVIEREGPTRIYPVAHYPMKIKVTAVDDFKGNITERLPGDFVMIDRGNADLQWGDDAHSFITATWAVDMKKGAVLNFSYIFDAPDRSPFLYELGPIIADGNFTFTELRKWQIASDAAGKMMVFYDDDTRIPAGWTCLSCTQAGVFYQRFVEGSTTYSGSSGWGGTATHTPTASATVSATSSAAIGLTTTTNTTNAPIGHSHTLVPQISPASNLPRYRSLRVLQYNSAGEPSSFPTSTIVLFDIASSSLPSGWFRYSAEDGYYPYAASTSGSIGGSNTHSHTATGTLTTPPESGLRSNGAAGVSAIATHTHYLSTTTTDVVNNEPPYREMMMARLSAPTTTMSNYMITMWDNTPPAGWTSLSDPGGPLDGRIVKASTTYGTVGGSLTHTHADINNATSTTPIQAGSNNNGSTNNAQAPQNHYHDISITGFSTDSHVPPYIEVIFAKRLTGIVQWTQNDFLWYANKNAVTPDDPWPSGGEDLSEDDVIDSNTTLVKPADVLRLRMNVGVANATATPLIKAFKLQYVAATDCTSALNWSDVGAIGAGSAVWRGYNNTSVTDGATLPSAVLSTSDTAQNYVEANNAPGVSATTTMGQFAEWDWVIQDNLATSSTNYCFRMVLSDGTPLDTYTNYPQATTNSLPNQATLETVPFDNEKVGTTIPNFNFTATDPEADDLDYEIQIDTSASFTAPVIDKDSTVNPELFDNLDVPTNKAPFTSGQDIHYQSTALTNGSTYWWRVRAKDSNGSNSWGAWSTSYSFTVDTTVTISTWHQTTSSQFQEGTFLTANSSTSDAVWVNIGSTVGTVWGPEVDFSVRATGTVWGSFKVASTTSTGSLRAHLEYFTSTSSWDLIPDSDLAGNSVGFNASSTSLLGVDPDTYPAIRPRVDLTTGGGSPRVLDWTINWSNKVNAPSLSTPFDNQKVATRTPTFVFAASDPFSSDLQYEISWSTSSTFTSSTTVNSATTSSGWLDVTNNGDTTPYRSGDTIQYTPPGVYALASSTTYYWRVRAKDVNASNVNSFWSSVYSITIDTTTVVATWFQTADGQWNTDTLTGMQTYATNTLRVATSTSEAIIGYGEGVQQTPKYRIWDGSAWSAQGSALTVNAPVNWVIMKASPVTGEYIMGTIGTNNDANVQVYNGSAWGNKQQMSGTLSNAKARGLDIAYETVSGRAIAVSCNGNKTPVYRIWTSTTSSWSSSKTITVNGNNNCSWIKMASNPVSNEIAMVERDTGSRYQAMIWDGSAWKTGTGSTTIGSITSTGNEGMAIEYNASGTRAFVNTSDGTNNRFTWTFWNGSAWSAAATVATTRRITWIDLASDPTNTNNMVACWNTLAASASGVSRWTGAAWSANLNRSITANSQDGKSQSCIFENTSGRKDYILDLISDTASSGYAVYNNAAWGATTRLNPGHSWVVDLKRATDGLILGIFWEYLTKRYQFSSWNGTSWTASTTLESSASVTTSPYLQPFMIAPKLPATQGTVYSSAINFSDGSSPGWDKVLWSASSTASSSLNVQVQYYDTSLNSWTLVPDSVISGNSSGTTTSPINIRTMDTDTYSQIRLVGNATCYLGICPLLNDWTVKWAAGLNISGTAKQHDLTTNVTSGTVAVAVNGVLQAGKTGTISNGAWSISNVTFFSGSTIEVFVSGAATSARAVNVLDYSGPGDITGMSLNEHWITIGSASSTDSYVSLTDLKKYDNSVSSSTDTFFDVDNTTGNFNYCALPVFNGCWDAGVYVLSGNVFQPSTSSAKTLTTYDMRIAGGVYNDANTLKVAGAWLNLGGFTPGAGTVMFNATSGVKTVDSTGAATSTFFNLTFGEVATPATWSFSSALTATGTLSMNFGTTSPGAQLLTIQGNLSIGGSGTFQKGTATTTFSGSVAKTWTDNTASKQDLGNITVNGTTKTITLGSSVKATSIQIASGNTLNAGGANTFTVGGNWDNNGVFSAQTGTVIFATSSTGMTINQGTSNFYNLSFNAATGTWRWLNTNATTSNDITIATGTVTLPGGTLEVGGSFSNTGGTFIHNSGLVKMTSTASGKTIQVRNSPFNDLTFNGSGGTWAFSDTNATTSGIFTILAGTPSFPSGIFEVGNNFINSGGSFNANNGTLKMTSSLTSRTITLGTSPLANLLVQNSGIFSITDASATTTGNVVFNAGTTTLPTANFAIGGSLTNTGIFTPGSDLVTFYATSGARTISTGSSSFASLTIDGVGGNFTVLSHATTTSVFNLNNANAFTMTSGKTMAVGGAFTNLVGGASTTWTGSTLSLNSGTNYSINTKTLGGDIYGTLSLAANTQVRSWNSSTTINSFAASASLYSQNHNSVNGEVDIFGAYVRNSGTDYWDYTKDFDGTALGSPRQAVVRFDASASASFTSGTSLEILGTTTASTSIDRKTGNYGITITAGTLNAQYYQFRNMNATGLSLQGSTTVTSLANGDFSLDTNGGTTMTIASTTIDTNPGMQIFTVKFATSTGISAGFNVTEIGVPASFWRFRQHYGNYAGEAFDSDPGPASGNPGYIKWDDSNFTISIMGTVYSDAGVTLMGAPTCDGVTNVVRVKVAGAGNFAAPCSATSSFYHVDNVSFNGDTVMTTYLDTAGGAQAVVVTKSASADLSGINLYQHRVIVRHEDVTPMTIADMKAYDKTNDTDIPFTASTSSSPFTLTTDPDTEFWVWTGKTFVPGGNLTLNSGGSGASYDGKFHIDNGAIFTAGNTETHSVGGGVSIDSGATFTAASSTFIFTATTTGKIITGIAPLSFYRMTWNGAGGGWTIAQNLTVNENFLTNAGTVSGTANVTILGTSTQGAGRIAMTGGTFTLSNGGTFGGPADWQFNNLNLGTGGAVATSTKTGSSTVTVLSVLTDTTNQVFEAGTSTTWLLSGGGTPLILSGTFSSQNSIFRYAASTGAVTATAASYFGLDFGAASSSSAPTYTLAAGTFSIASALNIGTSTGSLVTVNANTNDPTITASGNVAVKASSTFILSDTSATTIRRSWLNQGTTTPSGGTVTFDATTTGWTIDPGRSAFANILFNNLLGGWTITANATTTSAFSLANAGSFTMASGTTLEVDGTFTNLVGGASTTWATSTLYLNSAASSTLNTKTQGADIYGTLLVGANTQPRMWNSSAATTTLASTGSLYSMNHANVSGALNIYGAYTHTTATDYWDYANDFDGAPLGSPRVATVRIATSSTLTFSGGGLDVTGGASGGTTTIDVQNTGAYAFSVTGGTLSMQYYNIRNTDPNGLSISGTPVVSTLSDGDFLLSVNGGTMMTVAGGTIDANPLLSFFRDRFATSSGITSGFNVTATGVSASVWTFSGLNGNYAGEAFDNDPGGDPGYIRWDDSAAQITVSGNVYSDEGFTPIGGPVCNGVTQNVKLKVQGQGTYASACNAVTGAYSISNILYNPKDTFTLFLASTSNATAVNIAYDPVTNISNMHLYQNRVIVRHEQGTPIGIGEMAKFDASKDTSIPFTATTTGATTTTMKSNTGLVVWTSKTFAPGGTVILAANASSNSWDGSVHLLASSTWSGASTNSYTIGGQFLSENAASISPANTTFTFNATTSGKTITASTSLTFYNLAFSGVGGRWTTPGVSTVSNDFSIATGTVTLPPTTLSVGGSFLNTNGAFDANKSTVQFTSTTGGKSITVASSSFNSLSFTGSGGAWSFTNTNASTTATTTITAGTVTLPSGIFAVGTSLSNQSGTLSANGGTVKMTSTSTGNTILLSGSSLANLLVAATGTYTFLDSNVTLTGDMTMLYGTTTFPFANLTVGGSFVNSGIFTAGTSSLTMNSGSSGKSITTGSSSLNNLTISGAGGGFTITGNATSTGNFTLTAANTFTMTSGKTLAVGGVFTNSVGGAPTTWTGSTLSLYSNTSYSINTKASGFDAYDTMRLASTSIRMWGSSVATAQPDASSSIYSQNNANTSGLLHIYGNYMRTTGTDYWSYATDFDGTALGGSSRQANVRFAANATTSFSTGATLQMIGSATASTTVDRISSGNYGMVLDSTYWNAQYYQFRNMNSTGLNLTGTTTITSMNNGDFSLDVQNGSSITIASSSVNQNASGQIFYVKFATSSGITAGFNISLTGSTASAITFNGEYGNFAGEANDSDGGTACGSIRWSDSACLISDQRGFRWRYDDGAEGAPASEWYSQSWAKRERVRISNSSTSTITNAQVKMTVPYDSDMQANFQDLRFTDSSGTSSIPFWVEASTSVTQATVWVKVPSLPASSFADVFMYYGNPSATSSSNGISTFKFFDDFEDNNITEYTGDTSLFGNSTSFNYERGYGLAAAAGSTASQNASGIGQAGAGVGQDTTFRFFQYIDMSSGAGDEPCFLFGIQAPITLHQNYAVCLSPFGADHLVIAKNAKWNGRNASDASTLLSTKAVTYSTGWYEVSVDWLSTNNQINVNVYDNTGTFFASTSAMDSSYTSGGVGFTFWGMHGGWDIPTARAYNYQTPTATFGIEQADSGATWAAVENTYLPNYPENQNVRLRFSVRNSSLVTLNDNFRLQYAAKTGFPNCESVTSGNFVDVPINASCGGNAACMSTSAQFVKASSTQLLSIPTGYTFAQGQILEDPVNQSDTVSVAANQFTEVEYNFQLNANANQDRYCFRTTNAGVALDNYSHVAEIQVVHPPSISGLSFNSNSNIALTEGTTTTIFATGTVSDLNGYLDLVNASSTYYRSSVASDHNCTADNNNCYQIATTSCSFSNCGGNSCTFSCSTRLYYFADPTDVGSVYASDIWNAMVDIWDTSNSHSNSTANQEIYTLSGITTTSTIPYGLITVGADSGARNATTSVNNTGNSILNLNLGGDDLKAGASRITYDKQKYATSTFTYASCPICSILSASTSPSYVPIGVSKATTTVFSPSKDIYWGIGIPSGTAATTFSGFTSFGATQ